MKVDKFIQIAGEHIGHALQCRLKKENVGRLSNEEVFEALRAVERKAAAMAKTEGVEFYPARKDILDTYVMLSMQDLAPQCDNSILAVRKYRRLS